MFAVINPNSQLVFASHFIEIIVPIEYDKNSSQIPRAKCLFYCKTKRIVMNITCCLFVIHPVYWSLVGEYSQRLLRGIFLLLRLTSVALPNFELNDVINLLFSTSFWPFTSPKKVKIS